MQKVKGNEGHRLLQKNSEEIRSLFQGVENIPDHCYYHSLPLLPINSKLLSFCLYITHLSTLDFCFWLQNFTAVSLQMYYPSPPKAFIKHYFTTNFGWNPIQSMVERILVENKYTFGQFYDLINLHEIENWFIWQALYDTNKLTVVTYLEPPPHSNSNKLSAGGLPLYHRCLICFLLTSSENSFDSEIPDFG